MITKMLFYHVINPYPVIHTKDAEVEQSSRFDGKVTLYKGRKAGMIFFLVDNELTED